MKTSIVICALLSLGQIIHGQSQPDSLKILINTDKSNWNGQMLFNHYSSIAWLYFKKKQFDSAIFYYKKALTKGDQTSSLEASAFNNIGLIYSKTGSSDSAIIFYEKALEKYISSNDTSNMAAIESNLSILYKNEGLYDKAALKAYSGINKFKNGDSNRIVASCYSTLGHIYRETGDFEQALSFHKKCLSIRQKLGYSQGVGQAYNNVGGIFMILNQYDSALLNLLRALKIKSDYHDPNIGSTLNNIGEVLLLQGQYSKSIEYFLESIGSHKNAHDSEGLAIALNNLGRVSLLKKEYLSSRKYLDEAEDLARKINSLSDLKRNFELKVQLYEALKDYQNAFKSSEALIVIKDSLLNNEKVKSINTLQTIYETEKKEQQILLLEKEKQLNSAELNRNLIVIYALVAGVILALFVVVLIYHNFRLARSAKRRVELLLRELHHRVKNNLQILSSIFSLQSGQLTDANAIQLSKSGEGRVNAMALIHQKLYQGTLLHINMRDYITDLVTFLKDSYGFDQKPLRLKIDVEDIKLDVDKAIPIGLIVNELVSNTFKYAFGVQNNPELIVHLKTLPNGEIMIEIRDNGSKASNKEQLHSSKSFGLNMVRTLAQELHAELEMRIQNGTAVALHIPLNHI